MLIVNVTVPVVGTSLLGGGSTTRAAAWLVATYVQAVVPAGVVAVV